MAHKGRLSQGISRSRNRKIGICSGPETHFEFPWSEDFSKNCQICDHKMTEKVSILPGDEAYVLRLLAGSGTMQGLHARGQRALPARREIERLARRG